LVDAARTSRAPADLSTRPATEGRPLPARFRLAGDGSAVAVPPAARRGRRAHSSGADGAVGVAGGVGRGPVLVSPAVAADVPPGRVLVVPHLDPRLAPVVPRLAALVAETGNALSHLAILAREYRVPVVVGVHDATRRFADGDGVVVDGSARTLVTTDSDGEALVTATTSPGATP
jgi:pyruvate,water dikinase